MDKFIKSDIGMGFFGIGYHFGAVTETPELRGTSHLMEHLMLKPCDDMLPQLTRLGIDYNAYTADNRVVFWFKGLEEKIREVAEELYTRILNANPMWSEEAFNNEKSTVLQEYADTFNEQVGGAYSNFARKHYGYCGPIGLRSAVEGFTYQNSKDLATKFRVPSQIIQVGSTPYIPERTSGVPQYTPNSYSFTEDSGLPLESVPKEDKTVVGMISKTPIAAYLGDDYSPTTRLSFIMDCLTGGLESPLYQEIREKRGLSYFSFGVADCLGDKTMSLFLASTTNDRAQELRDVYADFFSGNVSRHISEDRYNDCRDGLLIQKKISNILPHQGAGPRSMDEYSKYDGLDNFSFADCQALTNSTLANLYPIEY